MISFATSSGFPVFGAVTVVFFRGVMASNSFLSTSSPTPTGTTPLSGMIGLDASTIAILSFFDLLSMNTIRNFLASGLATASSNSFFASINAFSKSSEPELGTINSSMISFNSSEECLFAKRTKTCGRSSNFITL